MAENAWERMDDRERYEHRLISRHGRPVGDGMDTPEGEGDEEE